MKSPRSTIAAVMAVFTGCFLATSSLSLAEQPKMEAAIDLLQEAKKSEHPLPLLEKAKQRLKNASGNKGGSRVDAIRELNKAIDLAKAGDKEKMTQKINRVIAEIHSGIAKAR